MDRPSGLLNIFKPPSMSSHDVVAVVRRILQTKKCGHGGTLDPAAVGVLPIFVGDATRLIQYYEGMPKAYVAEIILGVVSDTYDYTGRLQQIPGEHNISTAALEAALKTYIGDISQIPPMYSAIKVGGKKLYQLARQGIAVSVAARQVRIAAIQIIREELDKDGKLERAVLHITCSPGTYIRSLCHDVGQLLGCGAVMGFLIRTCSQGLLLSEAITLEELAEDPFGRMIPLGCGLGHLPAISLDEDASRRFCQGQEVLPGLLLTEGNVVVWGPQGEILGVGKSEGMTLKPVTVISHK